jgi:hypothetical protein
LALRQKNWEPSGSQSQKKANSKIGETMKNVLMPKAITLGLALMLLTTLAQAQSGSGQSSAENRTSPPISLPVVQAQPAVEQEPDLSKDGIQPALGSGAYTTYFTLHNDGYLYIWCPDSRINSNSRVFVAASEYSDLPTHRFLGSAHFDLQNIVPANGGVSVLLNTNWTSFPINIRLDVLVDP